MTLVIIQGGIDLSVGPVAALSAVLSASLLVAGYPVPVAIAAGLLIGAGCGLVNGLLVAYGGLQPFIVTLGTLSLFRALALIFTGGSPVLGVPAEFRAIFNGAMLGIPTPVVIVGVIAAAAGLMLRARCCSASTSSPSAATRKRRISRRSDPRHQDRGLCHLRGVGRARLPHPGRPPRRRRADPRQSVGARRHRRRGHRRGLADGREGVDLGTNLGAVILGAMRNGLTLLNVQAFYQLLATGLIIILAMLIDRAARGAG